MLTIDKADYIDNYKIDLVFNNGRTGTADLKQAIFSDNRAIFSKLRCKESFKRFKLEHSALVWFDELDMATEYLFFLAFKNEPELQEKFRQWGYLDE